MWGLSVGGGVVAVASGEEEGKAEWPIWPALSLEHVAADKAKDKNKGGERTLHECPGLCCSPFKKPSALYLYSQVSSLRQNKLSKMKRKDYKELKGNIYER